MGVLKFSFIGLVFVLFAFNYLYADPVSFVITDKADSISVLNNGKIIAKVLWSQSSINGTNGTININISANNILPPQKAGSSYSLNSPLDISLKDLSEIKFNPGRVKLRIYSSLVDFNLKDLNGFVTAYKITNDTSYQNLINNNSWFTVIGKDYIEFSLDALSKSQKIIAAIINILSGNYDSNNLSGILDNHLLVPKGKEANLNGGIKLFANSFGPTIIVKGKINFNGTKDNPIDLKNIIISSEENNDTVFANNDNKIICKYTNAYALGFTSSDGYAEDCRFTNISASSYSSLRMKRCILNAAFINSSKLLLDSVAFDSTGYFITATSSIVDIQNSMISRLLSNSGPNIENCYFHLNNSTIYSTASSLFSARNCLLLIENSRFFFPSNYSENSNCQGIPFYSGNYGIIRNNIVKGFRSGVELEYSNKAVIYNNTFIGNTNGIQVSEMPNETYIYNNIFYKNAISSIDLNYSTSSSKPNITYIDNNIYTESTFIYNPKPNSTIYKGTNNFSTDPLFQNETDYSLKSSSPVIDKGAVNIRSFSKIFGVLDSAFTIPDSIIIKQYSGKAPDLGAKEFGSTSGIGHSPNLTIEFRLQQNYPNPFNPTTAIMFSIPKFSYVELNVYDLLGRKVSTLINKELGAGEYKIQFNGSSLPSGVYIYMLQAGSFRDSKKLLLVK
jgi:hypothetical protein